VGRRCGPNLEQIVIKGYPEGNEKRREAIVKLHQHLLEDLVLGMSNWFSEKLGYRPFISAA